jgi:hypothetical protein
LGVVGGTALGLWYGWAFDPVEYVDTDLAYLHPAYADDYLLMVSEAYALDNNLDAAQARIALLALPEPAAAVADRAEKAIADASSSSDIQALVRLATAMGVQRDAFLPYLGSPGGAQ